MRLNRNLAMATLWASLMLVPAGQAAAQSVAPGDTSLPGYGVFMTWCSNCHAAGSGLAPLGANPLWAGNGTVANITSLINNITWMKYLATQITPGNIADIAAYLGTITTPPAIPSQLEFGRTAARGNAIFTKGLCTQCHLVTTAKHAATITGRLIFPSGTAEGMHFLLTLDSYTSAAMSTYFRQVPFVY